MLKNSILVASLALLAACGDPLRDMPRLSDVDLAEQGPVAQALPSEAEVNREAYFGTNAVASIDGLLTTPATPQPKTTGFFGSLRNALPTLQPVIRAKDHDTLPVAGAQTDDTIAEPPVQAPDTLVAALSREPTPIAPRRSGFFDQLSRPAASKPRKGVDAKDVPFGTVLPYGEVARVCDARRQLLGQKVESAPANGYTLYDSNPGAAGPRTYYITGFSDDCPRQLTAAHVVFGSPSFYELLHYGPTGAHLVTGATDKAYEQVKGRVCGARKGQPCGSKMRQLERSTFFVNAYERLDDNTRWSELLVHDGAVVAASLKAN